jgi:hypothetical protein
MTNVSPLINWQRLSPEESWSSVVSTAVFNETSTTRFVIHVQSYWGRGDDMEQAPSYRYFIDRLRDVDGVPFEELAEANGYRTIAAAEDAAERCLSELACLLIDL